MELRKWRGIEEEVGERRRKKGGIEEQEIETKRS